MQAVSKQRVRESKALEDNSVKYIRLRQSIYLRDKYGLSWVILDTKLADWSVLEEDEAHKDFKASPGFISRVMKDHNLIGVSLDGESHDMDDEEREGIMTEWRVDYWKKMQDPDIRSETPMRL